MVGMNAYTVSVHLSSKFRQTCSACSAEDFATAERLGTYDGKAFHFCVEAVSRLAAAEVAFAVCNSYPDEMHAPARCSDAVGRYRDAGHRSLSVGDIVEVTPVGGASDFDGRYGCAPLGFVRL